MAEMRSNFAPEPEDLPIPASYTRLRDGDKLDIGKYTWEVVTGKGHRSKDGVGKIRQATEQWIQQRGKRSIESYAPAPRAQGGSGAFVLILRGDS